MRKIIVILFLALSGCSNYKLEPIYSSDDFYVLTPEVIESIVHLNVCESQSGKCDIIRTGASHVHYWGADWFKQSNIIVLYSSDIGIYAWEKSGSWKKVEVTQEINEFADRMYEELKK
jgi:hypothetical protein